VRLLFLILLKLDVLTCAKEVVDALLLTFSLNNINLQIKPDIDISRIGRSSAKIALREGLT